MGKIKRTDTTKPMFAARGIWESDPVKAFDAFVASVEFARMTRRLADGCPESAIPALRPQSRQIYHAMFRRFHGWMVDQGIMLSAMTPQAVERFLQSRNRKGQPMQSAIRMRYLRMLERVFSHLGFDPNPAARVAQEAFRNETAGKDQPKAWLSEAEQAAFLAALPNPENWKARRDRAMLCMLLGAGLTVDQVSRLKTNEVGARDEMGEVPITVSPPADTRGLRREHRTILRAFAAREVLAWKDERVEAGIAGPFLFPSTLAGKQINKTTIFLIVKGNFKRAQLDPGRYGGRTLRNSFAVRELQADGVSRASVQLIGEQLGLHLRRSALPYAAVAMRSATTNSRR